MYSEVRGVAAFPSSNGARLSNSQLDSHDCSTPGPLEPSPSAPVLGRFRRVFRGGTRSPTVGALSWSNRLDAPASGRPSSQRFASMRSEILGVRSRSHIAYASDLLRWGFLPAPRGPRAEGRGRVMQKTWQETPATSAAAFATSLARCPGAFAAVARTCMFLRA